LSQIDVETSMDVKSNCSLEKAIKRRAIWDPGIIIHPGV